jgi:hypothetical protein
MDNNKVYITLVVRSTVPSQFIAGVGCRIFNVNLLSFLKQNYYKYEAFNIKLESFHPLINSGSDLIYCLHLRGLDWINGYDTLNNYGNSRVLDIVGSGGTVQNTNYVSNTGAIGFRRPENPILNLDVFFTNMNGTFFDRFNTFMELNFVVSITGIDQYKVRNPSRGLRYDYQNKLSSTLVLTSNDGVSIDPIDATATKGRIKIYRNINLRSVIGSENYDKYDKFALVVRRHNFYSTPANPLPYSTGNFWWIFWLSGSNLIFENPNYSPQTIITVTSATSSLGHSSAPVMVAYNTNVDTYFEYKFLKPSSDLTDIVINYSFMNQVGLAAANTANNDLFPYYDITFEIIPVVDV